MMFRAMVAEIGHAYPQAIRQFYTDEGAAFTVLFIVLSPVIVPIAAVFYYSIDAEQRELLDESVAHYGVSKED